MTPLDETQSAIEHELTELEGHERRQSVKLLAIQGMGLWGVVAIVAWALGQFHWLTQSAERFLLATLFLAFVAALIARFLDRNRLEDVASQIDSQEQFKDELVSALERAKATTPGPWDELLTSRAVADCQKLDPTNLYPAPASKLVVPSVVTFLLGLFLFLFAPQPVPPSVVLVNLPPIPGTNPPGDISLSGDFPEGTELPSLDLLDPSELRKRRLEAASEALANAESGKKGEASETEADSESSPNSSEGLEGSEGSEEDLEKLEEGASDDTLLDELRRDLGEALERQQGDIKDAAPDGGEEQDQAGDQQQAGGDPQEGEESESQEGDQASSAAGEKGDQLRKSDQPKPGDQAATLGEGAQMSGDQKTETDAQAENKGPALGDATGPQAGLAKVLADEIPLNTLAAELALETALLEAKPAALELAPLEPKEMASPSQDVKLGFQAIRRRTTFARESRVAPPPIAWRHHPMLKRLFPADPPDPDDAETTNRGLDGEATSGPAGPVESSNPTSNQTSAEASGASSLTPSVSQEPE